MRREERGEGRKLRYHLLQGREKERERSYTVFLYLTRRFKRSGKGGVKGEKRNPDSLMLLLCEKGRKGKKPVISIVTNDEDCGGPEEKKAGRK